MNEERTRKCLRQVEHIRGHLWHRYSITVNQVIVVTSTLPKGTLGSVASLLAVILYQGNPDMNHKLWNIVSTERYILHMQVLLECYKCVVNQKLEHVDDISFRELFGRIRVFFQRNKIYLFLAQGICIYVGLSFFMKHSWTNSLNMFFSLEWGIVVYTG